MPTYSSIFRMKRAYSADLHNDPYFLEDLKADGFKYIRRYDERSFDQVLRRPTIGCMVELFQIPHCRTVPINSPAGKKIINRICYF
jgi:hypothetical protein